MHEILLGKMRSRATWPSWRGAGPADPGSCGRWIRPIMGRRRRIRGEGLGGTRRGTDSNEGISPEGAAAAVTPVVAAEAAVAGSAAASTRVGAATVAASEQRQRSAAVVAANHYILSYTKPQGQKNQGRLSGQGVLSVDGTLHTLDLECEITSVPKDGSCWAHAVLGAIHKLDIDRLVRSVNGSESSDWRIVFSSLREWKRFGEQSLACKVTTQFREHVARRLLDPQNATLCREHIEKGPSGTVGGRLGRRWYGSSDCKGQRTWLGPGLRFAETFALLGNCHAK